MASHAAAPAATPAPTTVRQNPDWIRGILVSIALSVVLGIGFGIPFVTALTAIFVIFLTQVLYTDLSVGFQTGINGLKFFGRMIKGVVIFLALRYLAAGVVGIYPIDSKNLLWNSGGLQGLAWSKDIPTILMWETVFAFVAGKLVSLWVEEKDGGKIKFIFAFSLLVLSTQQGLSVYYQSFPSREAVSQKLVDRGIIGGAWDGLKVAAFGKSATPTPAQSAEAPAQLSATLQKVLVLKFDGFTPVDFNLAWEFDVETQGDPIILKFPGVPEPVRYSGKGDMSSPSRTTGTTRITSGLDKQEVRIRISEVRWIRQ